MSRRTSAIALDMHRGQGLITSWQRHRDDSYTVTGRAGWMADGSPHYRDFRLAGEREVHIFVNALAFAAQAVDAGVAERSVLAQVRDHLKAEGKLP